MSFNQRTHHFFLKKNTPARRFKAWLAAIRTSMMVFEADEVPLPDELYPGDPSTRVRTKVPTKGSGSGSGSGTGSGSAGGVAGTAAAAAAAGAGGGGGDGAHKRNRLGMRTGGGRDGRAALVKLLRVAEFRERKSIWSDDGEKATSTKWLPNTEDEFQINEHIWVQFHSSEFNAEEGGDTKRKVREYSLLIFVKDVRYRRFLLDFHSALMHEYYEEQKRTLTAQPHVFELVGGEGDDEGDGSTDLKWSQVPFSSTRSLDHVWFKQRPQFMQAYTNFLENRASYERRGDPYTFSVLLHGHPGCGKSSLIKALVQDSLARGKMRHVFLINFERITNGAMLNKVFFDTNVNGHNIPSSDRLMIFEDFSASKSGKVFFKRNLESTTDDHEIRDSLMRRLSVASGMGGGGGGGDDDDDSDDDSDTRAAKRKARAKAAGGGSDDGKGTGDGDGDGGGGGGGGGSKISRSGSMIDMADLAGDMLIGPKKPSFKLSLSEILGTLDGINERTGSISVWTTNRALHTYDPAFLRPGRMDLIIEFTKANPEGLQYLIDCYFLADFATEDEFRPYSLAAALEGEVDLGQIDVRPLEEAGLPGLPKSCKVGIAGALELLDDKFTPAELKQACKESRDAAGTVQNLIAKLAARLQKEADEAAKGGAPASRAGSRAPSPSPLRGRATSSSMLSPITIEVSKSA
jgi:hypothetical protein